MKSKKINNIRGLYSTERRQRRKNYPIISNTRSDEHNGEKSKARAKDNMWEIGSDFKLD